MFKLELSETELDLMKALLVREEADTRVEIHHTRSAFQYQETLKTREKELHDFLEKLMRLIPG